MSLQTRIAALITAIKGDFDSLDSRVTTLEGAGVEGASAYEVAVAEGFVGDEAAWLASLVGPDGADGTNVTITVAANQSAFDAATPGATELVVLYSA